MELYFITAPSEPVLSLKYAADFLREALAAIAAAGLGPARRALCVQI
jgi:hypothetical protein